MAIPLGWLGISLLFIGLSYDFYTNWLDPRLRYRQWYPYEPDLPPVAGGIELSEEQRKHDRVLLALYLPGILLILLGVLDASSVQPKCLPAGDFFQSYGVAALSITSGLMWYSEGEDITIKYHSEIRYMLGLLAVLIHVYSKACGTGVL
jgi:hypothetical protein